MKETSLVEETFLVKETVLMNGTSYETKVSLQLSKWPTSYNGSDKGEEDVLLVADAYLLVVHLCQEDILNICQEKLVGKALIGKMLTPASCSEVRQKGRRMQSKLLPPPHRFLQSAYTLGQENTWNSWNSLIRKYAGHSLLFLIVPFMWRKAYHRFGTGQRVAHNENRIPPQFAHTVSQNIICETKQILNTLRRNIICETELFSPWGMVQSSQCFHSCTGWTGCILWNISTERGRHDIFISTVTWFWTGSSSLF